MLEELSMILVSEFWCKIRVYLYSKL